jgi:hypothetical protein
MGFPFMLFPGAEHGVDRTEDGAKDTRITGSPVSFLMRFDKREFF